MLHVVLVGVEGCENTGSVARVMMNFGVYRLILISPNCNHLSDSALNYAIHARKILENARVEKSLTEVINECDISIAFSRRVGQFRRRDLTLFKLGDFLKAYQNKNVFLVFGREKTGLTNEEIQLCDLICTIPASEEFPSINLSHAVGIVLYELYKSFSTQKQKKDALTRDEIESTVNNIISFLTQIDYFKNHKEDRLKSLFKKFLFRANLDRMELQIIDNLVSRVKGIVKRLSG
jgi:tRNA/rRNA methyltransferase